MGDTVTLPTTSKGRIRAKVVNPKRGPKPRRSRYPLDVARPKTRGDCQGGVRPCAFVSCKFHLYLDVDRKGSIRLNFPHLEVDELTDTCALDVADRGGVILEDVGGYLNITRERSRQIEVRAAERMSNAMWQWKEPKGGR